MPEYFMFNKPKGCVSARTDARHKTVFDYFPEEYRFRLFNVGRLDRDTEGLLIFTDDGALCYKLTSPKSNVVKKYFFWAHGIPDANKLAELEKGAKVFLGTDALCAPAKVSLLERKTLREIKELLPREDAGVLNRRGDTPVVSGTIEITEGKKHQVKRMIRYSGAKVVYLKRIAIGALSLDGGLAPGEYRELSEEELRLLL